VRVGWTRLVRVALAFGVRMTTINAKSDETPATRLRYLL
jgi:hypothetical protein